MKFNEYKASYKSKIIDQYQNSIDDKLREVEDRHEE